jgi:signal recognition particle receptor subunit beta
MVQINFALREVNCKIVYYGPGLSGKTTNLEMIHTKVPDTHRGDLTSIATEGDRTLFFDFMPLDLGKVAGMNTRFQLYTVPGQVYYNATRKLVLQGVDGIIFVADSQEGKLEENKESLQDLLDNLQEYNIDLDELPFVMQYNKRDLPNAISVEKLEQELNPDKVPCFESVAITGEGVFPTLKKLANMVLETLNQEYGVKKPPAPAKPPVSVAASPMEERPAPAPPRPVAPPPAAAAAPPPRPAAPPPAAAAAPPPRPVAHPPAAAAAPPPRPAAPPPRPAAPPPRPAPPPPRRPTPAPRVQKPPVAMPERRQYIPGKSPEDKIQRRREITIPSEGKGPGWLVAFIFLIIGFVVGVAAEHYVKILDKILSG